MLGKWFIAAIAAPSMMFAASTSLAQTADTAGDGGATCGTMDECLEEGDLLTRSGGELSTTERQAYAAYVQACAFGSGQGCYNAGAFAAAGAGTEQSQAAAEQFMQVGCQLDHAMSCREASLAARAAGRRAEGWAFLALEARLIGREVWQMDGASELAVPLPDGREVLPPNDGLAWAPQGVSTALTCAGYWQAISPDSPEAAGWKAAARAAFVSWPPLANEPPRTAEEADQWIGDQAVIFHDGEGSALDQYDQLTIARCFMGRSRLLFLQ